jgi:predicted O-linked N-acetylglucosamine transferase (SPINDLY family)
MSWLGYLGSTGLPNVQFRITDAWVDPPGHDLQACEQPFHLNRTYVCYQPSDRTPEVTPPPMLSNGYCTFGSFNTLAKLSGDCLSMWCDVLSAVPYSRLIIKAKALRDLEVQAQVKTTFSARGVSPDRLKLMGWTEDNSSHLDIYREVDIALDSYPFNGVTTTCEATWMGVPVVSLVGQTPAGRQGLTLLTAIGTPDQAVQNVEAFVSKCVALSGDAELLAENRRKLRNRMATSPLMDHAGFASSMEQALRVAWHRWCESSASSKPS